MHRRICFIQMYKRIGKVEYLDLLTFLQTVYLLVPQAYVKMM